VANHKQAAKRARQSELKRLRNMVVTSRLRTRVRALRYAVDQMRTLESGRTIHPQEVEKHLRWLTEGKAKDLAKAGFGDVIDAARQLLGTYDAEAHKGLLRRLARADLKESARLLDNAASKGVLHKRTASRRISRLNRLVNSIDAAA
jgi:ribosomal protein S20